MAVEKSIVPMFDNPSEALEVEVIEEDQPSLFSEDDTVMLEDGGAIVGYVEEDNKDEEDDFYANLAEEMDERDLQDLASDLVSSYKDDLESRQDWLDTYTDGLTFWVLRLKIAMSRSEGLLALPIRYLRKLRLSFKRKPTKS